MQDGIKVKPCKGGAVLLHRPCSIKPTCGAPNMKGTCLLAPGLMRFAYFIDMNQHTAMNLNSSALGGLLPSSSPTQWVGARLRRAPPTEPYVRCSHTARRDDGLLPPSTAG